MTVADGPAVVLNRVYADEQVVEGWSDRRLPLEPKGDQWHYRKQLRDALRTMRAPDGKVLVASYASSDEGFCDVENVLIYNVGTGCFGSLTRGGLRFRRLRIGVAPDVGSRAHHQRYEFEEAPPESVHPAAAFEFELWPLNSSLRTHQVWWSAAKASACLVFAPVPARFSLRIELAGVAPGSNLAAFIKPLVDGIVAAMHLNSSPDLAAVDRLVAAYQWERQQVLARLASPVAAVLGERQNVVRYRNFVRWDPADHLCEDCAVLLVPGKAGHCRVVVTPY